MARLTINGKSLDLTVDPSTPLLWAIREQAGLTGTKYGCGIAQCGACTVHLDGAAVRSCVLPVAAAELDGVVSAWRWRLEPEFEAAAVKLALGDAVPAFAALDDTAADRAHAPVD